MKSKKERHKKWSSVVQGCFFLQKHTKCLIVVCAVAKLRSYRQYWFGLPALRKQALGGGQEGWSLNVKSVGLNRPFFERGVPSFQCLHVWLLRACAYRANRRQHCLDESRETKGRTLHAGPCFQALVLGWQVVHVNSSLVPTSALWNGDNMMHGMLKVAGGIQMKTEKSTRAKFHYEVS